MRPAKRRCGAIIPISGEQLARRGIEIDAIRDKVAAYPRRGAVLGVGTGGTRFARFPGAGEPRDIFDKIEDCAASSS